MVEGDEFLARSGIEFRSLEQWIERQWVFAERRTPTLILSEIDAARARLIHDLKRDFGVNDEGVDIVLHLIDQLHGLRQVLSKFQIEIGESRKREI